MSTLGIDSGEYSFGYVATWVGGDADAAESSLRASGSRITRAAAIVLDGLADSVDAGEE